MGRQADGREGELAVLDQVVAYDREAVRVAAVDVTDAARRNVRRNLGLGARGRVKLLISHREGLFFLGGQALAVGCQSRRGPFCVLELFRVALGERGVRTGLHAS